MRSGSWQASTLLATTIIGLSIRCSPNCANSFEDHVEVVRRIAPAEIGHIHQMHEHASTLNVPQKLHSKPVPIVRAFDQSGTSAITKVRSLPPEPHRGSASES